jgi:2-polyprenyl-6-methoxyphenol hydroxylase-like FAD-dependent oxidoreductase
MANYDYDVIAVGGGLGGAALAKVLAEKGLRVLVLERERQFKDRIRGESMVPWGVAEAQKLGLYDLLLNTCAHQQPFFLFAGMGPPRDLRITTPQQLPALTFFHPAMQEVVLEAARNAGAEVWRGAAVRDVRKIRGRQPATVSVEVNGAERELSARLVVCADGRSSMGRSWGGFEPRRGKQRLLGAGVMFENMAVPEDSGYIKLNPGVQRVAVLFPQGGGRVRAYIAYGPHEIERLQGMGDADRFIEELVRSGAPPEFVTGVRPVGPLATFDMTETWVDNPYSDGLALIGDAAGSSDPTWGQGLSLTARDARVLAEKLLANDDWDAAGRAYAREHDIYFQASIATSGWQSDLFFDLGPDADARRARALPKLMSEPARFPDHVLSGPELPSGEHARRRFFGED